MTKKTILAILIPTVLAGAAGWTYWQHQTTDEALKLYGTVDLRTVSAAFEATGKIVGVMTEEGRRVRTGDLLAEIDSEPYRLARNKARGDFDAANARHDLTRAGARSEDIRAAKAQLSAAVATKDLSVTQCRRQNALGPATSEEKRESACAKAKADEAHVTEARERLALLEAGYRDEEKREAKARLETARAALALAERKLADCRLTAPVDGVIRARYRETGDMAGPNTPVFEIAVTNPMWARVWIDEVNLHKIRPGMAVQLTSDSYPDRRFAGTIGFISDVAEFTPRTVQTEALRTSLVYEVRVTVEDSKGDLRLGMPVTVEVAE